MTHPGSPAKAPQHHCVTAGHGAETPVPLDAVEITATIATILEPRSRVPSGETSTRWHERLREHLSLLTATMAERIESEPHAGTPYAELVTLALLFIRDKAAAGLPGDPELAYSAVCDLARRCRTLLGLVADEPEGLR
ncbi:MULTISPECIES: DUF6415 family natural product biosynthesis protein [unclassified Streptomyces]|uniref:DUF6415 family natural product biosynthesis protein n=1 Tax=unclassified Streptomyces TaxID=2593676 RepID=UPI0037FFC7CE